jgi:7-keto-8-aminopelargonate synthetase-like enzyme
VSGNLSLHEDVERHFADTMGAGSALLCASGYGANVGALSALLGPDDLVVSDALNHASLIDGIRLSRAKVVVVPHNDLEAMRLCLRRRDTHRRAWIVCESLYSMDGDVLPWEEVERLALEFECSRYVDEAHAIGVMGQGGRGLHHAAAVAPEVRMIGFGKALGSSGAALVGSRDLKAWLWNHSRSFVFSTAVAPGAAAAAQCASSILLSDAGLLARLRYNVRITRDAMQVQGIATTSRHPEVPILPVIIGDDRTALEVSRRLLERGYFVQPIRPPTVPEGTARLRITVSAEHHPDELLEFVRVLANALP